MRQSLYQPLFFESNKKHTPYLLSLSVLFHECRLHNRCSNSNRSLMLTTAVSGKPPFVAKREFTG